MDVLSRKQCNKHLYAEGWRRLVRAFFSVGDGERDMEIMSDTIYYDRKSLQVFRDDFQTPVVTAITAL